MQDREHMTTLVINYILYQQNELKEYEEYLRNGEDPRDCVYYMCRELSGEPVLIQENREDLKKYLSELDNDEKTPENLWKHSWSGK